MGVIFFEKVVNEDVFVVIGKVCFEGVLELGEVF